MSCRPLFSLVLLVFLAVTAQAQPVVTSTPETQERVSLTIYNQNFAVVREQRPLVLQPGLNLVRYEGVPAQIDPTSLSFVSLTDPGRVVVREQNYQYDLIGRESLLNKAVGQRIELRRTGPGGTIEVLEGVLLSQPSQGLIVQLDDGRVLVNPQGEIMLAGVPDGLISRPSLLWHLRAERGGTHQAEVSYLTGGLSWQADYVALVSEDEDEVDLTGWVTLTNQSGATYTDAQLQLLAGDVRRVQENVPQYRRDESVMQSYAMAPPPAFAEESFFEYHLYTLDGTTTIAQNETKQMTLLSAAEVGVRRQLIFDPARTWWQRGAYRPGVGGDTQEGKVNVMLELANTEANRMGMPLPKGRVRVYKKEARGNLQFLGEDLIDHTPRNETVRLYIGDAFDVVGTRKRTQFNRLSDRVTEETYEISLRNRKETPVTVMAVEHAWGDWTIRNASHEYENVDAQTFQFPVTIPADSEVTIRYTIRSQW